MVENQKQELEKEIESVIKTIVEGTYTRVVGTLILLVFKSIIVHAVLSIMITSLPFS